MLPIDISILIINSSHYIRKTKHFNVGLFNSSIGKLYVTWGQFNRALSEGCDTPVIGKLAGTSR